MRTVRGVVACLAPLALARVREPRNTTLNGTGRTGGPAEFHLRLAAKCSGSAECKLSVNGSFSIPCYNCTRQGGRAGDWDT
eukprot:3013062-Prymnesium_polylepis.4